MGRVEVNRARKVPERNGEERCTESFEDEEDRCPTKKGNVFPLLTCVMGTLVYARFDVEALSR